MKAEKRILLLTTGGTIGGQVAARSPNNTPADSFRALRRALRPSIRHLEEQLRVSIHITQERIIDEDSSNLGPVEWSRLIRTIADAYESYDGFVVTHGTNTMAYTCAALAFGLTKSDKPVVVTGSQLPFGRAGTDALKNLENAVRVALWSRDDSLPGVVCVFGSKIIAGTRVTKKSETDYDGLRSHMVPPLGRIGSVIELDLDLVERHRESHRRLPIVPLPVLTEFDNRVLIIRTVPGMKSATLLTICDAAFQEAGGLRGLVLHTFGDGDVPLILHDALAELSQRRIPVAVASQTINGRCAFSLNEPGQQIAAAHLGIAGEDMTLECLTVKMMWLLANGVPYQYFEQAMLSDICGEVTRSVRLS